MHLTLEIARAERLLGCRRGATADEVRAAYRQVLFRTRPDLGSTDGDWVVQVQGARDLLLAAAPPDRRRRRRSRTTPPSTYLPMRRASWGLVEERPRTLDLRV